MRDLLKNRVARGVVGFLVITLMASFILAQVAPLASTEAQITLGPSGRST